MAEAIWLKQERQTKNNPETKTIEMRCVVSNIDNIIFFSSKEQRLDTDIRHVVIFSVHQMCDMGVPQFDGVI